MGAGRTERGRDRRGDERACAPAPERGRNGPRSRGHRLRARPASTRAVGQDGSGVRRAAPAGRLGSPPVPHVIYCRTLGPVELTIDGEPPPPELLWRKPLALLIYLARSPKRTRSRRHLAGLLWGDRPDDDARHSLNEAIRLLRRSAGHGLESAAEQVRLAPNAVRLDVEEFEVLAAE